MPNETEKAAQTLKDLQAKRVAWVKKGTALQDERAAVSFAAHEQRIGRSLRRAPR
jgi:hypothetical protein